MQKHRKMTQEGLPQFNIFIDEIQNENLEKGSIISQIMREGRKYNLGLNISTQFIGSIRESHTLRQAGINRPPRKLNLGFKINNSTNQIQP